MRLLLAILGAVVAAACGFWAYEVNYATQAAERRVRALQVAINAERERMQMLRAEWAWLNRPERLRALVEAHEAALGLVPLDPGHFGTVAELPEPLPELAEGWDGLSPEDIDVTVVRPELAVVRPHPRPGGGR
ncbi:MAG: cell division protein FtsL [Paracoccaceae bacterium]|nr:MAG: cell division protein FtsL [Paracoccaceae bacterium]